VTKIYAPNSSTIIRGEWKMYREIVSAITRITRTNTSKAEKSRLNIRTTESMNFVKEDSMIISLASCISYENKINNRNRERLLMRNLPLNCNRHYFEDLKARCFWIAASAYPSNSLPVSPDIFSHFPLIGSSFFTAASCSFALRL